MGGTDGTIKIGVSIEEQQFVHAINNMKEAAKPGLQKLSEAIQANIESIEKATQKQEELTTQYGRTREELEKNIQTKNELGRESGLLNQAIEEQTRELDKLETELQTVNKELDGHKKKLEVATSDWVLFKTTMTDTSKSLQETADMLNRVGTDIAKIGGILSLGLTTPLVKIGKTVFNTATEFETAMARVAQKTGQPIDALGEMERGVRNLATEFPFAATEIANTVAMAAQLGVSEEYLMDFTTTMLHMGISTVMSAEESATAMARFLNVTGSGYDTVDQLGSAVSYLGNNFAATEKEIMAMATRLAGAGTQINLTDAEIVGISAALSSVGLKAEMAGSAMSRVMTRMHTSTSEFGDLSEVIDYLGITSFRELELALDSTDGLAQEVASTFGITVTELNRMMRAGKDLENFAEIAGMTADEFRVAFGENAVGAIEEFIIGLGNTDDVGREAIDMLNEMGISEIRLRDTLLRTAGAHEIVSGAIALSTKAYNENTALVEEAEKRYQTTASQIQVFKNTLNELGMSIMEVVIPVVGELLEKAKEFVQGFLDMDEETKKTIVTVGLFAAALGPVLIVVGGFIKVLSGIVDVAATVTGALGIMGTGAVHAKASVNALAGVFTFLKSPLVLATAGVVALVYILEKFTPVGENARVVLYMFVASLVAFQTVKFVQGVITGITTAMTGFSTATALADVKIKGAKTGIILYTAAIKTKETAMKLATIATKLWGTAVAVAKGKMSLATVAAKLMGAAMTVAIGPIGLLVVALAAVAGAIVYFVKRSKEQSEVTQKLAEDTERLVATQEELLGNSERAAGQFADSTRDLEIYSEVVRDLVGDIEELAGQQELTAEELAYLNLMIEELNKSVPGLTLAYDEQTGALNLTTEAIEAYLIAAEAQAELDLQLAESSRLKQEAIRLSQELAEAEQLRSEAEEKLAGTLIMSRREKKNLQNTIEELNGVIDNYTEALEENGRQQEELQPKIKDNASALNDAQIAIEEYEQAQRDAAEALADLAAEMEEHAAMTKRVADAQKAAMDKMEKSIQSYEKIATNAFGRIQEKAAVSFEDMIQNLKDNQTALENWSINLEELVKRGVDKGLIQTFKDAGPESAAQVRVLIDLTEAEIAELNEVYANGAKVALESFRREHQIPEIINSGAEMMELIAERILESTAMEDSVVDKIDATIEAMGKAIEEADISRMAEAIPESVIDGIESRRDDVEESGADTASAWEDGFTTAMEMHSPSKVMERHADTIADSLIDRAEDNHPRISDSGDELARAFIDAVANAIANDRDVEERTKRLVQRTRQTALDETRIADFSRVGRDMTDGVANGIMSGTSVVSSAATRMINEALAAMRAAAATASPSKKTEEIADDMTDGLVIRTKTRLREVRDTGRQLTSSFIGGAADNVSRNVTELDNTARAVASTASISAVGFDRASLALLGRMMEAAVVGATGRLVTGFNQQIKNITSNTSTTHSPEINFYLTYHGEMDYISVDEYGRELASKTMRELRGMGVALGGVL